MEWPVLGGIPNTAYGKCEGMKCASDEPLLGVASSRQSVQYCVFVGCLRRMIP